jgi:isoamylase
MDSSTPGFFCHRSAITLTRESRSGPAYPLGATFDGSGTNFALFSEAAHAVDRCLFDDGVETRIPLTEVDAFIWHAYLPTVHAGQLYC